MTGAIFTQMKEFLCRLQTVEDMLRAIHSVVVKNRTVRVVLEGGGSNWTVNLASPFAGTLLTHGRDLVTMRLEAKFVLVSQRQHRLTQWESWSQVMTFDLGPSLNR